MNGTGREDLLAHSNLTHQDQRLGGKNQSFAQFGLSQVVGTLLLSSALGGSGTSAMALDLSQQNVVDLVLKQSTRAKSIEAQAEQSVALAERLRSPYDFVFRFAPTYEVNKALTLTGTGNPEDRTWTIVTSAQKSLSTGTQLTLQYDKISQSSTLSSFTSSLRRPEANLDAVSLAIRQSLWRNILGESDRAVLTTAETQMTQADLLRQENLEEAILAGLTAFWNAYVAETQLRENTAARDKYSQLVASVRRKTGFGASAPGELPRLEAEFESADARVKLSAASYLAALDQLRTLLQIDPKEPIQFKASPSEVTDLPKLPQPAGLELERLRPVRLAQMNFEIAERNYLSARSLSRPRLDLVARAKSTGVDEKSDQSFAKMGGGSTPTYAVGVELEWPLDSSLFRAQVGEASAGRTLREMELKNARDSARDQLAAAERNAAANRDAAIAAITIVNQRSRVVRELEQAYRQGRTTLVELIRSYNDLFVAQLERVRSVGNYQIALNQWAAVRDELIRPTSSTK